jgi:hypothetical protein
LSNHCQDLHHSLSESCTKFDAVPLSEPSRNRISPDTRLQIKGLNDQHVHPAAWDFIHCLPLSSTIPSRYYNCCTDGSISLESYGYPLVYLIIKQFLSNYHFNKIESLLTSAVIQRMHLILFVCHSVRLRICSFIFSSFSWN